MKQAAVCRVKALNKRVECGGVVLTGSVRLQLLLSFLAANVTSASDCSEPDANANLQSMVCFQAGRGYVQPVLMPKVLLLHQPFASIT